MVDNNARDAESDLLGIRVESEGQGVEQRGQKEFVASEQKRGRDDKGKRSGICVSAFMSHLSMTYRGLRSAPWLVPLRFEETIFENEFGNASLRRISPWSKAQPGPPRLHARTDRRRTRLEDRPVSCRCLVSWQKGDARRRLKTFSVGPSFTLMM